MSKARKQDLFYLAAAKLVWVVAPSDHWQRIHADYISSAQATR